jgi:peptide/nickel transport system ATP-binding protein
MNALEVDRLSIEFHTDRGVLHAVDRVSFSVEPGKTLAVVGESGCGKSATALAILGLLAENAERLGDIRLAGELLTPEGQRKARGRELAMIFQEPMTSLNPAFTAGEQVAEALRLHEGLNARDAMARAVAMLERVRIPDAVRRAKQYPHQLSGGMRQRVMIAIALACRPKLLIADEPTTALDVTVQAQIMELLRTIQQERGTAILLISHNLGLIAGLADRIAVMYAGRVVEEGPAARLLTEPEHPYTIGLLGAVPRAEPGDRPLVGIEGSVPDLRRPPPGCVFEPRCPFAEAVCREKEPTLRELGPGHAAACHMAPLELAA